MVVSSLHSLRPSRTRYDSLDVEGEADYKSVLFWPNKCALVQSLESISPCNEDVLVGHGTHASMTFALESVASPEGKLLQIWLKYYFKFICTRFEVFKMA